MDSRPNFGNNGKTESVGKNSMWQRIKKLAVSGEVQGS